MKKLPPALVNTWITLARSNTVDQEVKIRALLMLREKIGNPSEIVAYMKENNLS